MFNILLKCSSQYSKSIVFSCWPLSIHFFEIHYLAIFYHTVVVVIFWKNNFDISFRGNDFTIVTGDGNTNYIALCIVSRLSNQIHLSISGLLIVMGKPVRRKEEFGTKQLHNGLKNQPHGNWKIKTIRTIRSKRICRFYKCFIPDAKKY